MKYAIIVGFSLLSSSLLAQIEVPNAGAQKKCYEKRDALKGKRFVEWECGKIAGVIDCNEKLEYDEGSNTLFSKSSGSPFTGKCETCHQNGILERRINFVNGKEDGPDSTYYETGCLMVVRNHIGGKENGKWVFYYDSTQYIAWEMNYAMGEKNGPQIFMGPKGDTTLMETYKNGVLNGKKKTFYAKSKVEKEVNYLNGVFHGPFIIYNKEGKILQSLNYKQGKKDGTCTYYYDDGTLLRTESWLLDQKNGEFKTLYYNGTVQVIENYKKGLKEGWFEERFPDQKLKRRAFYKKDVLMEEHVYNDQGKEISTFGGTSSKGAEDDEMPVAKTKKPKKEKKSKKGEAKKD